MDPQYFKDVISSEKITQLLSSSTDTKQILNILKIKQLITNSSDVEFDVRKLFCDNISGDAEDFCSILKLVKIAPNEKIDFLNKIINFVRQENCPEEIMYQLKLLNTVLEIETDMNKDLSDQIINTFKYLVGKNLYLNLENIEINRYICNYILPKFLKDSNDPAATSTICELAQKFDNLHIICSNYKYVLNDDQLISVKEQFHKFIQDSLGTGNSRRTKNAIFIIRQMKESKEIIKLYGPTEQLESILQLIEVSAEKQLHLIKPSMHLFGKMDDLHYSWKIIVYSIYLRHPHLAVITETVQIILLQQWYLESIDIFTEFLPEILQALNKIKLITLIIENFKLKIVRTVNHEMMSILFEESTKIAWKPVQFYHIFQIFLENMKLTPTVISKILKLLKTIPDRTVRNLFMDQFLSPTLRNENLHRSWLRDYTEDFLTFIFNLFVYYYECCDDFLFNEHIEILLQLLRTLKHADYLNGFIEYHCNSTNELNVIFMCYLYYHRENLKFFRFSSIQFPGDFYLKYFKEDFKILGDYLCTLKLIQSDEKWWTRITNNNYVFYRYDFFENILLSEENEYSIELQQCALQLYAHNADKDLVSRYEDVITKWTDLFLKEGSTIDCKTCRAIILIFSKAYTKEPSKIVAMFDKICDTQPPLVIVQYLQSNVLMKLDTVMLEDKLIHVIRVLMEMKKSRYMLEAVECFLRMSSDHSESLLDGVRKLSELSDDYPMLAYTILRNLRINENSQLMEYLNILLNLMVDKKILAKDERTIFEVMINSDSDLRKRKLYSDGIIGILFDSSYIEKYLYILTGMSSMLFMLYGYETNDCTKKLFQLIFEKYYKNYMKRYYADSQIHMEKLRLFQILLLFAAEEINLIAVEMILTFTFDVIHESNQTSVKQLLQLLILKLLNKLDETNFAKWFDKLCVLLKSKDSDNSTIITLIPILYHLVKLKKELELCETITAILLPHTMGPQFKLRLYAQQTICWIYEFTQTNLTIPQNNYVNKYEALYDGINSVLLQTEIKDSATKSDFHFMRTFSMEKDFSMHTILVDIPRLNGVSIYEWKMYNIKLHDIMKSKLDNDYYFTDPIEHTSKDSPYNRKVVEDNYLTGTTECTVSEQSVIIQKKITTWKDSGDHKKPITGGKLIVVTSLIESRANIGGLSRTSDIFGVDTLIVNDGKVCGTQDFRNLSMSSEKWVNMVEVKVNVLKEYLLQAKLDGFTIVGAEQTSGSKMLDQYRFEEKTVLLLGNEKSGIPADLINLLDVCVEIPQFGVVRSLNVHVAGALFIWEYTKQQQTTSK